MNPGKVKAILDKAGLASDGQFRWHSDTHVFQIHEKDFCDGFKITRIVYMVEMIRKGDYKDALSDYNNSVFIKTLKDLKRRLVK